METEREQQETGNREKEEDTPVKLGGERRCREEASESGNNELLGRLF